MTLPAYVLIRFMWCRSCQRMRPLRLHQATPGAWQCRSCQQKTSRLELVK